MDQLEITALNSGLPEELLISYVFGKFFVFGGFRIIRVFKYAGFCDYKLDVSLTEVAKS